MGSKVNIVLVGFMGTGKTVVGQALARRLGRPFYDMDRIIQEEQGMNIPAIFKSHGEAYFRECEAKLARRLADEDEAVIACGGGVVLNSHNTRTLSKKGVLVSLTADVDTLVKRLKDMEERPLLAGSDLKLKVEALLKERRSIYEEAPVRVSSSGRSVEEVVDEIVKEVSPKLKGPEAA